MFSSLGQTVGFGKYKGRAIRACLRDVLYWEWLLENSVIFEGEVFELFQRYARKHRFIEWDNDIHLSTEDSLWDKLLTVKENNILGTTL